MKVFQCYACGRDFPKAFGHEHHRIPQAAGGTDKDIVWLCAGDHAYAHSLAYMLMNPKRASELEQTLLTFNEATHRDRMAELANTVALEMLAKAEGQKNVKVMKKVILDLTEDEHRRYLTMARDRKLSLVNFFLALARRESDREL